MQFKTQSPEAKIFFANMDEPGFTLAHLNHCTDAAYRMAQMGRKEPMTAKEYRENFAGRMLLQKIMLGHEDAGKGQADEHDKPAIHIGYATLQPARGSELKDRQLEFSLTVFPPHQRNGYGTAALRKLVSIAFSRDWSWVDVAVTGPVPCSAVTLSHYKANPEAHKFYTKCGFRSMEAELQFDDESVWMILDRQHYDSSHPAEA